MNPYEILDLRQSVITGSDLAKMPVEIAAKVVALKREVQNFVQKNTNQCTGDGSCTSCRSMDEHRTNSLIKGNISNIDIEDEGMR